jgi:hypothetical protein
MHSAALEDYLARLEAALAAVPAAERREILLETRSHVLEQASRSPARGVAAVLAELGPPESYARQFVGDEPHATTAPAPPAPTPRDASASSTLHGLARLGAGGWRRLPMLLLVLTGYGIAGLGVLLLISEIVDPPGTGFVIRDMPNGMRHIGFALSDTLAPGDDVFGAWFAPLLVLLIAAIHLGIRALLRRELRRDPPHAA